MRGIFQRLQTWLHEPEKVGRFWCYGLVIIVLIGLIIPAGATHAQSGLMTDALNYLLTFVAFLLEKVILMLGKLVIMLVDTVIRVAQYNSFTQAAPVKTGWPIIRDVFNMFFIVILLISAFSTIIGYEKFHYSTIIKKFFLMAALINFSLPLFGVAIDFSQILMLTFVNGFRAAAAGNFVTMLKLDKVMSIEKIDLSPDNGTTAVENPMVQKVTAMMFGIFILGISATILAIMVVYLVARIVGLWILLITSPGALFVTGLPSSLQGKIPGFGNDWWNRLWTLLMGGPIMAFFLWLALATASQVGPTFTDKSTSYAGGAETDTAEQYFQTAIGSVENFGSYIVAVMMLFVGLSTAVSTSASTAPAAGKLAGKIRDIGVGSTKFLAYGGVAAGGAYGVRKLGNAAGDVGSAIDRRYGLTKSIGTGIQTIGIKTGWTGAARVGSTIAGTRGRAVKKEKEKFEEMTKGLSTSKRMDFAQKRLDSMMSNEDERKGLREFVTKSAFSPAGQKHLLEKYDAEAEKKFGPKIEKKEDETKEEKAARLAQEQKFDAYKKRRLLTDRKDMLDKYQKAVGEDETEQKWIKEKRESTPSHAEDISKFVSDNMAADPSYFRKVKVEDFENLAVSTSILAAAGIKGNDLSDKDGLVGTAMKGGDRKAQMLRATMDALRTAAGEAVNEKTGTKGMTVEEFVKRPDLMKAAGLSDAFFVKAGDEPNGHQLVLHAEGAGVDVAAAPTGAIIRNEEKIAENQRAMDRVREQMEKVSHQPESPLRDDEMRRLNGEMFAAQTAMVGAGAAAHEVFHADDEGHFSDKQDREHFETTVQNVFNEAKKDYRNYSKVDLSVINRNPNGTNEARQSVARQANINELASSFQLSKDDKNKTARNNIANIVRAVETEGNVFERSIEGHNKSVLGTNRPSINESEIVKIGQAFNSASSESDRAKAEQALQKVLQGTSVKMDAQDAGIYAKHYEVKTNPLLRNYSRHASSRTTENIRRAIKENVSQAATPLKSVLEKSSAPIPEIEDAQGLTPSRRAALERESKAKVEAIRRWTKSDKPDTKDIDENWES